MENGEIMPRQSRHYFVTGAVKTRAPQNVDPRKTSINKYIMSSYLQTHEVHFYK